MSVVTEDRAYYTQLEYISVQVYFEEIEIYSE